MAESGIHWPRPARAPCQGWGRGFESPRPLQIFLEISSCNSGPSGPLSLTLTSSFPNCKHSVSSRKEGVGYQSAFSAERRLSHPMIRRAVDPHCAAMVDGRRSSSRCRKAAPRALSSELLKSGRQRVQPRRGGCRSGYDGHAAGSASSSRLASYSSISVFSASASAEICSLGAAPAPPAADRLIGGSHSLEDPCSSRERAGGEFVGDGGGAWILTQRSERDRELR